MFGWLNFAIGASRRVPQSPPTVIVMQRTTRGASTGKMALLMREFKMRIGRFTRRVFPVLRDASIGLVVFAVLLGGMSGGPRGFGLSEAAASGSIFVESDVTSPPDLGTEHALIAALARPTPPIGDNRQSLIVLGLTFSLIFAFNAAIARHLHRVYASPPRGNGGATTDLM